MKQLYFKCAAVLVALGTISLSTCANADDYYMQSDNCCQPCAPSYCISNCCGQPCCPPPACGVAFNPPGYCKCSENTDPCKCWNLDLDFLWWKACVGGVALGTEEDFAYIFNVIERGGDIYNKSRLKKPDFKFDPGFRIALSDYCICDCWDMGLAWTYYHTTAKAHGYSSFESGQAASVFLSYWERVPSRGDFAPNICKGRYSMTMNLLDLEFGRKYYVSSCFVVRPFFGLRGAKINQNYKVRSENLSFLTSSLSDINYTSDVKSKNNYLAVGPRVGLEAQVHLGCGLSLVGNAAGSIVYGRFKRDSREQASFSGSSGPTRPTGPTTFVGAALTSGDFSYSTHSPSNLCSKVFTDLSIGLRWERCFDWCCKVHPVAIEFAWEHHGFFNMVNFDFEASDQSFSGFISPTVPKKVGDIFTQGLTVSASLGF